MTLTVLKTTVRRQSLREPVGARRESLLLSASPESFSSAASVASCVSAAISLSSDLVFLESFFTVNRPSRLLGQDLNLTTATDMLI